MLEESTNLNDVDMTTLIGNCHTRLSSLATTTDHSSSVNLFKTLLEDISKCMVSLKSYLIGATSKHQADVVLLCVSQIHKCLPLLLRVVENTTEKCLRQIQESKRYIIERIRWCFSDVLTETQDDAGVDKECGSKFVHTMDAVLEQVTKLVDLPEKEDLLDAIEQLTPVIEELLCHAMTIAQISESLDYQGIIFNSQKVLRALDQLKAECVSFEENQSMSHMFVNSLADSLECLEQRVNTSVLRLVLQVFCEPYAPLKTLVQFCASSKPATERKGSDLDEMVVDLDLRMDRIMQIGLFAMACTGDPKRILSIRSCLASLESLEPELVPTLTAFYLDPTSVSHRSHLKLLTEHWQTEIAELHRLLDAIVDPAAFCQVSTEEVKDLSLSMKASIESNNGTAVEQNAHRVIQRTKKLVRHLQSTLGDLGTSNQNTQVPQVVHELSQACHECEACVRHVFTGQDNQDKLQWKRVLKRCQLIVSTMKKLQPMLVGLLNASQADGNQDVGNKTANECPQIVDLEEKFGVKENIKHCLLPYLDAGKVLSQERSIMYITPKRQVKMSVMGSKLKASAKLKDDGPKQVVMAKDNLTLGLEVTAILDKLTLFCDTLSSSFNSINDQQTSKQDMVSKCQDEVPPDHHKNPPSDAMLSESSASWVSTHSVLLDHDDTATPAIPSESSSWMSSIMCSSHVGLRCDDNAAKRSDNVVLSTEEFARELFEPSLSLGTENSSSRVGTLERISDLCKIDDKLEFLKDQFHT